MDREHASIASRDDFFRVLAEVQAQTRRLLAGCPGEPTLQSLAGQLESMRRWSADGRTPRAEERSSLDFGPRASALEDTGDAGLRALARKLFALRDYFAAWPEDEAPPLAPRGGIRERYLRMFRCA
jgi:hypothetical protein